MQVLIALVLLDVFDLKAAELSVLDILKAEADLAVVGKLAAHFRIKRSLVKHDYAVTSGVYLAGELAVADDGKYFCRIA